nr:hypothetical protein [uncultured Undibacterium sp.]
MAKHLLYLTNTQLSAAIWDKGELSSPQVFDNFATGWSKFADYLKHTTDLPAYFLTDLIEEDFHRESIPHVYGSAHKNLIERRLNALYRDTPYREASRQGREKEGRKDDQMLFSALTNPQLLKPWIDALQAHKIDIAGIYSVALLNPYLSKPLGLGKEASLIVTHQSSGLRQSFFQDGYLRFSRLAPETAWSAAAIADTTALEIGKTRQFLASTRQVARGAELQIVVIAEQEILSHLQAQQVVEAGSYYRLIDLNEARQLFKMQALTELHHCDSLFLSMLGRRNISSHYATDEQARTHYFSQLKHALNVASVAAIAMALFWSAKNGFDAYQAQQLTEQAQIETLSALAKYQSTANSMPSTIANPKEMRAAVDLEQTLRNNAPKPAELLTSLSQALDRVPQIKIQGLTWETSETDGSTVDPNAVVVAPVPLADGNMPLMPGLLGIPKRPFEILNLEAEVLPFQNDYRSAVDNVQLFVSTLQKDPHLKVSVIKPPLDTRPSMKLESQAGNDDALAKPRFTVKIIWKP